MARPKLFIGSSKSNIGVARLVANRLESDGSADVTVWDEGVFSLNKGYLEKLLAILSDFDFAVLIWAPDDVTESKGESMASPRDNVIFECGLFMGAVGRERVFIVSDQSVSLKIPSDLAGITLATYDGSRVAGDDAEAAVRMACDQIAREIQKPRFPMIVGEWLSRYPPSEEPGHANTAPNESNAVVFTTWVLAKKDGSDEKTIRQRLQWAEAQLKDMTVSLPPPALL